MTKYTQKFKLDLIQEYLDTGCSQRCLENKYSLRQIVKFKLNILVDRKTHKGL